MRIIPASFDEMEEKYISGLAKLVHQHKIPPDLVYGQYETNAQFVSGPNITRAEKGAKRVRSLGVGYEKPQTTVTFTLKETGDVVGMHQLIFWGKNRQVRAESSCPLFILRPHGISLADTGYL